MLKQQNAHVSQNDEAFSKVALSSASEASLFAWQAQKIALIARVLRDGNAGSNADGRVLADVGCFTGVATLRYRDAGFSSAVGFDANEDALSRVRTRGLEGRLWLAGSGPCPARDGEFAAVVAADVIEHIVDTDSFVSELKRITASGGRIIVTTPNLAFWLSRIRLALGRVPWSYPGTSPSISKDILVDRNHIRVSIRDEWEALFVAHGLVVERVAGWSILDAIGGGAGMMMRQAFDKVFTRSPALAFGLLFELRR